MLTTTWLSDPRQFIVAEKAIRGQSFWLSFVSYMGNYLLVIIRYFCFGTKWLQAISSFLALTLIWSSWDMRPGEMILELQLIMRIWKLDKPVAACSCKKYFM